ncbi:LytR/AlgR family response regulator transcription factor [Tenacibaculum amylolyticum]|uniref:LytR/AlgR family response regulator transcription factor n=1 Tax=Tenacibaculum amylolyticum TaxID=104269 RepID=UPI003892DEE4
MRKDRLYLLTVLSITLVFLIVSVIGAEYFVKVSANQLIEAQVETSKREANEIASIIDFQLTQNLQKDAVLGQIQKTIAKTDIDAWFLCVFDWSGKKICHPNITKIGEQITSNANLLASLKEKNISDDLYDLLVSSATGKDGEINSEVIHIVPVKSSDLLVAANVNTNSVSKQMKKLKRNFYFIFLFMGILATVLSSFAVRIIGSRYEKDLEAKNLTLASEVINLSKLNSDLVSYQEKKEKDTQKEIQEEKEDVQEEVLAIKETSETSKKRILTYVRNELVPVLISDIAYVYTENTITYIVSFDGKRSTSNASLDDMYSNFDPTLFFRANRQFIISISAIDKIIKYGKSQLKILLNSANASEEIIISKNKAAEFKQWLNM